MSVEPRTAGGRRAGGVPAAKAAPVAPGRNGGDDHRPTAPTAAAPALPVALLWEARPKQWAKNVLVFTAPLAAGVLTERRVLVRSLVILAAYCLAASGSYFLNDVFDVEADRQHPSKRLRPIASGAIPVPVGIGVGVALIAGGVGAAFALGWKDAATLGVYLSITMTYTLWLKHVAVVDLACVASGFVIRAIAGGVAAEVPISQWFLIVAGAGSLFIVAGKRQGEFVEMGEDRADTRPALASYTIHYLRFVWMLSAAVAISAYCLWAFEQAAAHRDPVWYQLSIIPFVLAMLRYALRIEEGHGGAPEDVILSDPTLLLLGVVWVVVFGLGVHLGH